MKNFTIFPSDFYKYQQLVSTLRQWLLGPASSVWLSHGVDRSHGGYFDQLSFDAAANSCDFKRLRVCARQIYSFAKMAEWGVTGAQEVMFHGLDFLFDRLRHDDGGFIRSTTLKGAPLDMKRDLYDHAFVVFALASAFRRTCDSHFLNEAHNVIEMMRTNMTHPSGGFVEALPPVLPRRQNPHMHLLEACLAWVPLVADDTFKSLANDLLVLFEKKFYDSDRGILFEYFSGELSLPSDPTKQQWEPGHHFEWIWLLGQAQKAGLTISGQYAEFAQALANTARTHGVAPATGLPYGAIRSDGSVADSTCRIWVITEWLRACLVEPTSGAGHALPIMERLLEFLDVPQVGLWRERRDVTSGIFFTEPVPASSLYHIVSALTPILDTSERSGENWNGSLQS